MSDFDKVIHEISINGQSLVDQLQTLIHEVEASIPNYMKYTPKELSEGFLKELENYKLFFKDLPEFVASTRNSKENVSSATFLSRYAVEKKIRKLWHPSHIPRLSFENTLLFSLKGVFVQHLENFVQFLRLYKQSIMLPDEPWLQAYKALFGEEVSLRLALFSYDLPCMEAETNVLETLTKSFSIVPQKPVNKPQEETTNETQNKPFTMRGSFNNYKKNMENKFDIIQLLLLSFRSAICNGEFGCKNSKRQDALKQYTPKRFFEFVQYLNNQGLLEESIFIPFKSEQYVEKVLRDIFGLDEEDPLTEAFTGMDGDTICCGILEKFRKIRVMGNNNAGGRRKNTRKANKKRRKTRKN